MKCHAPVKPELIHVLRLERINPNKNLHPGLKKSNLNKHSAFRKLKVANTWESI